MTIRSLMSDRQSILDIRIILNFLSISQGCNGMINPIYYKKKRFKRVLSKGILIPTVTVKTRTTIKFIFFV